MDLYFISAMVYIRADLLHEAVSCLHSILLVPCKSPAAIQIAALRKLLLLELILDGTISALPMCIQRRNPVVSLLWQRVLFVKDQHKRDLEFASPEKCAARRPERAIYPEEYIKLLGCVGSQSKMNSSLCELQPKLTSGEDWDLATHLFTTPVVLKLAELGHCFETLNVERCLEDWEVTGCELEQGILAFNRQSRQYEVVIEHGWLRFALPTQHTPSVARERDIEAFLAGLERFDTEKGLVVRSNFRNLQIGRGTS